MKSIKTKGLLFSLSIILIAITTLGFSAYFRFKNILLTEIHNAVERIANESADHLTNYIDQFTAPLLAMSEDENINSMDWPKQKVFLETQINPYYLNVAVVDKAGTAKYLDDTTLDLSDRDYIQKALVGEMAFSEVIISRKTNAPVIMVAVPIYHANVIEGALIARLDVDFLSSYATTRGYGENGRAYIISKEGTFISRPDSEKLSETYNLYDITKSDTRYRNFSEFVQNSSNNESGFGEYSFEDNHILMGYASIKNTDWKIYIGTYEADALKSLYGMRMMLIMGMLLTVIMTTIAAGFFVNIFTKPITELDNLFSMGAQGDLTIRFTPKTKDEIGRLGISFNRMMDKIKTLTQYDPLTELQNQYVLEKEVDLLVHNEKMEDFYLIMISIDRFSSINETYGYKMGDIILCEVAHRILDCIDDNYQVFRYKGDEFVILGNHTLIEPEVDQKAQQVISSLRENYRIQNKVVDLSICIGTLHWNEKEGTEEPLKSVTQAKNYAKYLGSNQIQKFNLEIHNKLLGMKELQADIIEGLAQDQFFLVFQPLFYLGTEKIAEIEALIRWKHPKKGMLFPDQFIELAEQSNSIIHIDYWVLETACKQIKAWMNEGKKPVLLSINLSSKTFETKKFVPNFINLVQKYNIDPTMLQLEITERMVINNVEESIIKLNNLRKMGIRIAIDDFGIGYSSLSYIVRLPIDSIKIDKSFVQNITSSKEAKSIVTTIINLCKTLNLNVIAEGIESKIELEYLRHNQCDIGQGYYFSKPVSMEEIEKKHM